MSVITMPNPDWLNDGDPTDEEQFWWAIMEPSSTPNTKWRAGVYGAVHLLERAARAGMPVRAEVGVSECEADEGKSGDEGERGSTAA